MKSKNSAKKLSLNRAVISHLDNNEMKGVNGGSGGLFTMVATACLTTTSAPPATLSNC